MKKTNIKKQLLGLLLIMAPMLGYSQTISATVINTAGGHFQGTTGSIDANCGEIAICTMACSSGSISQGFLQPLSATNSIPAIHTSIVEIKTIEIAVFPNPASEVLYINCVDGGKTNVSIINMAGQEILTNEFESGSISIEINTLPVGQYIVRVSNQSIKNQTKTIKISKI